MSIPYVYDAGALLAIDRNDRRMLALEEGRRLIVPAVVVAHAWRDARRQVYLGQLLHSCEVVPIGLEVAKAAGILCGKARTRDVVDATVVTIAMASGAIVFTSDPDGIAVLAAAADTKPSLVWRRV